MQWIVGGISAISGILMEVALALYLGAVARRTGQRAVDAQAALAGVLGMMGGLAAAAVNFRLMAPVEVMDIDARSVIPLLLIGLGGQVITWISMLWMALLLWLVSRGIWRMRRSL